MDCLLTYPVSVNCKVQFFKEYDIVFLLWVQEYMVYNYFYLVPFFHIFNFVWLEFFKLL